MVILRIAIFAANLMRTSDGNSLSTQNVEFRIQNEDFPALPGANHLENRQTHVRTVCTSYCLQIFYRIQA